MRLRPGAARAGAFTLAMAAALLAAPLDAEAKGGRRLGGGGSIGRSAATADKEAAGTTGTHLTLRPGASSRRSAADEESAASPGRVRVVLPGPAPAADPEEEARRAKAAAERAEAQKAAAERAEELRRSAEKLEAQRAAQRTAEEQAEEARLAAAAERKKRAQSAVQAEVEAVLERARNDYPVLRTPEGEPTLRAILQRQKVLQASGVYPSIAMVEAVADHADALRPRQRTHAAAPQADATPDYSKTYGNCRWLDPYTWSCK